MEYPVYSIQKKEEYPVYSINVLYLPYLYNISHNFQYIVTMIHEHE